MLTNSLLTTGQYVVFLIHEQSYAVAIEDVVEIIRPKPITGIAGVKDHIEGVINLRGMIIPVISLRKRFGLPTVPPEKRNRILVVKGDMDEQIGIRVDEVLMVSVIDEHQMETTPDSFQRQAQTCLVGFAKHEHNVIGLLDLFRVLYPNVTEGV